MSRKYVRALQYTTTTTTPMAAVAMKFIFELWNYCLNGGVATSGVFNSVLSTHTMPTNFIDGTSLLAQGTDGYTLGMDGYDFDYWNVFGSTSVTFDSSMVGKYVVMWKPGSGSTEDSIYRIIGYRDPHTITIDPLNGGTPNAEFHPRLTNRSNINFRIINPLTTGFADGNYMYIKLDPTGVNAGQADGYCQMTLRTLGGTQQDIGIRLGNIPSGGSFSGLDGYRFINELRPTENSNGWFSGSTTGTYAFTFIADNDFLLMHAKNPNAGASSLHVEIPHRLYPQSTDPNPMTVMVSGLTSLSTTSSSGSSYGTGFCMRKPQVSTVGTVDLTTNTANPKYYTITRSMAGDCFFPLGNTTDDTKGPIVRVFDLRQVVSYRGLLVSEGFLFSPISTQFNFLRCKLKNVLFTSGSFPQFHRIVHQGQNWIHLHSGIMWPWDGSIMPYNLFVQGN